MTRQAVLQQALKLSLEDQERLAQELLARVKTESSEDGPTQAQRVELRRRLKAHRKHPADVIPHELAMNRLRQKR
ncbi:MAG: addiction module protein [Planctomycetes bacterium]|nr:addiction module protein [Planctomycetota bacterium]